MAGVLGGFGWMDRWMGAWLDAWLDGWMGFRAGGRADGRTDASTHLPTEGGALTKRKSCCKLTVRLPQGYCEEILCRRT